jgi:alkylation response protein AidB-like acyl-CoA dehydrogenase
MDAQTILDNVREVSAHFAMERSERQQRRGLEVDDFAQLREAGFLLAGVPVDHGGIWESVRRSTRPLCELLRTLAHQCLFTAVIVGIVEATLQAARRQVARRRDALRAYERMEWARVEQESWLI